MFSHQTRFLGSKYTKNAFAASGPGLSRNRIFGVLAQGCVWYSYNCRSPSCELTTLLKSLSWIWGATLWRGKRGGKERDGRDGRKIPPK